MVATKFSVQNAEWQGSRFSTLPLKRIGDRMVNTLQFFEQLRFTQEVPHTVRWKTFPENETVPLHYASSIEIILTNGATGKVTVGQTEHTLREKDCIYVPPWVVHSTSIKKCDGMLIGVKISPEMISHFINIEHILSFNHLSLYDIATVHDCFDEAYDIVCRLIDDDDSIMKRMSDIMELIELLARNTIAQPKPLSFHAENTPLHQLIIWTGEHYMEKLTVDDAAKQLHLSKSYFCKFFKAHARTTYLTYLNQVRVNRATMLLRQGMNVVDCANACGFTNVSYFIRLFTANIGYTPGEYLKRLRTEASSAAKAEA